MLSPYSIALIATCTLAVVVMFVMALRDDDKATALTTTTMAAMLVGLVGYFGAYMIEESIDVQDVRDREAAQVKGIEDRYDVEVTHAVFGKPGDWKVDDTWVRCFIPDEDASPADVTLSCDPASNSTESYVDFADLN